MGNIFKQASWLVAAQLSTRIISFFYTIFLARNLGVSDFGLYSLALAYFALISTLADFGFNRFLIKEIATDYKKISKLVLTISFLRIATSSVLFALFSVVIYYFDPDKIRVHLILLAFLAEHLPPRELAI